MDPLRAGFHGRRDGLGHGDLVRLALLRLPERRYRTIHMRSFVFRHCFILLSEELRIWCSGVSLRGLASLVSFSSTRRGRQKPFLGVGATILRKIARTLAHLDFLGAFRVREGAP